MNECCEAAKTNSKSSKKKILPTTERLFERICYKTKMSLRSGKGTEILFDPSDRTNCEFLCVCERTIRNHMKILCEAGMIRRVHNNKHIYELNQSVLSDILNGKPHRFYKPYLKQTKENTCKIEVKDNIYIFPIQNSVEKNSEAHIYNNQENKSNKSDAETAKHKSAAYTVQDAVKVMKEELGEAFCKNKMTKNTAAMIGAARNKRFETLEMFREYCSMIKNSWIYWSERIRNGIIYMLKFSVIDTFFPKAEMITNADECFREQELHVESTDEPEECKVFRKRILDVYGGFMYKSWMTRVSLTVDADGKILINEAANPFTENYVKEHFLK